MDIQEVLLFRSRREWRKWLSEHHRNRQEVWVFHYKKGSGKGGVQHEEAVEDALCYGWIDGKLRSVDEEKYALRYSPRRKGSVWSGTNKATALRMIKLGRMTEAGIEKIDEAKRNGNWASAYSSKIRPSLPGDLKTALRRDKKTINAFMNLSNSHRLQHIFWVDSAKKIETRRKRIDAVVKIVRLGRKSGDRWWRIEADE